MATMRWISGVAAVAQVQSYTFGGTWESDDKVRLTIGSKTVDVTGGSTTITTVIDAIVTAWNALDSSIYPEFAEITASRSSSALLLTADTAGVPFTVTLTPLEANGGAADAQTIEGAGTATTGTASTACTGPNHWDAAGNWSGGAVPTTGDTVYFDQGSVAVKYGMAQSAVTLAALHILASYTGEIGLPALNELGSASYTEYRATYLAISATLLNIGAGPGQGSGRLKLNVGSAQCTMNVYRTGVSPETDLEAVQWKGTHASNVVNINRGSVAIAGYGGDTSTVATLNVGFVTSQSNDAQVRGGAGLTLTTLNMNGGQVLVEAGFTTLNMTAGALIINAGNVTTLSVDSGFVIYKGTGTIDTVKLDSGASLDFTQDMRARTVTNTNLYAGSRLRDDNKTVTWTNPPQWNRCNPFVDGDYNLGGNISLAPVALS